MLATLVIFPLPLVLDVCTLCFQAGVTILFIILGGKWYWHNVSMSSLSKQVNGYPVYPQKGGKGKAH